MANLRSESSKMQNLPFLLVKYESVPICFLDTLSLCLSRVENEMNILAYLEDQACNGDPHIFSEYVIIPSRLSSFFFFSIHEPETNMQLCQRGKSLVSSTQISIDQLMEMAIKIKLANLPSLHLLAAYLCECLALENNYVFIHGIAALLEERPANKKELSRLQKKSFSRINSAVARLSSRFENESSHPDDISTIIRRAFLLHLRDRQI